LYGGLFLIPWVLLYASTGFLFNHPGIWPEGQVRWFGPAECAGTGVESLPAPAELAAAVTAALQERLAREGNSEPAYRVVAPERAAFTFVRCTLHARGGGQQHAVHIDLAGGRGWVISKPTADAAPFATREGILRDGILLEHFRAGVPPVLRRLGLEVDGSVDADDLPDLVFYLADQDGSIWRVTYAPGTGTVQGERADSAAARPPVQGFLKSLHFSCGYTGWQGAATFWPVFVDGLTVTMLFWVVSGLCMWWQIKAVRISGLLVLLASGLAAVALTASLHGVLAP
jgi:hypothetical protein